MSLIEKAKASDLKYSPQAMAVLQGLDDNFDIEAFEKFVEEKFFVIGSVYIIEFLAFQAHQKEKANKKPVCNPAK